MQRDVKIGLAIGVLLIALIAIFWYVSTRPPPGTESPPSSEANLPPPVEPVAPVGAPWAPAEPASPMVPAPAAPAEATAAGTSPAPGAPAASSAPVVPAPAAPVVPAASAPQPFAPSAPPATSARTHTVASGDTFATLAKRYYNDAAKWQVIQDANKGVDPRRLKVGMTLVIPDVAGSTASTLRPAPAAAAPPAGGQKTYTVAKGDTLSSIAKKCYGSDAKSGVDRIYQANKAKIGPSPDNLIPGMALVIPPAP